MHEAARENDVEELRRLLDEEPGLVEAEAGYVRLHERPLHAACSEASMEAACFLLDRGADMDTRNRYGQTPLMRACMAGRAEVVRLLLAKGADPALRDENSGTALMWASSNREHPGCDHVAVIRLLLEDGRVPVDARDLSGRTALWWACFYEYAERARVLLLEGGADHTIANDEGMTPMARARRMDYHETVQLLEVRALRHATY